MAQRSIALMDPRRLMRDDFFDNFWHDSFGSLSLSSYGLDMYETDNEVVVNLEAPGFNEENVDITIDGDTLTIYGSVSEKEEEGDKDNKKYYHREISKQSFSRAVTLPARVESEKAEADFENGVITVTLPKAEESKPKKIEVKKASKK